MQDDSQQPYQSPQTPPVQPSLPGSPVAPQSYSPVTPQAAAGSGAIAPTPTVAAPIVPTVASSQPTMPLPSLPSAPLASMAPNTHEVQGGVPATFSSESQAPSNAPHSEAAPAQSIPPPPKSKKRLFVTIAVGVAVVGALVGAYVAWQLYFLRGLQTEAQKTIDSHITVLRSGDQTKIADEAFAMNNVDKNTSDTEQLRKVQADAFTLGLVAGALQKGSINRYDQEFGTNTRNDAYLLTAHYEVKLPQETAYYKVQAIQKKGENAWKIQGADIDNKKFQKEK